MIMRRTKGWWAGIVVAAAALGVACSSSEGGDDRGSGVRGSGGRGSGGNAGGASTLTGGGVVGQIDGVDTKLPELPRLRRVAAAQDEDSVSITFDPVDDAVDYRVYPLPLDRDIELLSTG